MNSFFEGFQSVANAKIAASLPEASIPSGLAFKNAPLTRPSLPKAKSPDFGKVNIKPTTPQKPGSGVEGEKVAGVARRLRKIIGKFEGKAQRLYNAGASPKAIGQPFNKALTARKQLDAYAGGRAVLREREAVRQGLQGPSFTSFVQHKSLQRQRYGQRYPQPLHG